MDVEKEDVCRNILQRVADSGIVVKSQQRSDPDLTIDEKTVVLKELLLSKPAVFLYRFGSVLTSQDLVYFETLRDNLEVDFYIREISSNLQHPKKCKAIVRNRRYNYMSRHLADKGYFSDKEMRRRSPLLFQQYIGKYLDEKEVVAMEHADGVPNSLSEFLLNQMDNNTTEVVYQAQQQELKLDRIAEKQNRNDSSDEDQSECDYEENSADEQSEIEEEEKQQLRDEFTAMMKERFLSGEDDSIDYTEIDRDHNNDCVDVAEQDEQERYFDEDDSRGSNNIGPEPPGGPFDEQDLYDY